MDSSGTGSLFRSPSPFPGQCRYMSAGIGRAPGAENRHPRAGTSVCAIYRDTSHVDNRYRVSQVWNRLVMDSPGKRMRPFPHPHPRWWIWPCRHMGRAESRGVISVSASLLRRIASKAVNQHAHGCLLATGLLTGKRLWRSSGKKAESAPSARIAMLSVPDCIGSWTVVAFDRYGATISFHAFNPSIHAGQ